MKALIFIVFAFIALYMAKRFIGPILNSEIFNFILFIAALIIVALGVPLIMVSVAFMFKIKK